MLAGNEKQSSPASTAEKLQNEDKQYLMETVTGHV
jgi:hypothetical protein